MKEPTMTPPNNAPDAWPKLPLPHGIGNNLVTPVAFAQSSMFCAQYFRRNTERTCYVYPAALAAMRPYEIRQTEGCALDQGDADVFLELLRRAFSNASRTMCASWAAFEHNELLRALGRTPGGKTRTLLDESLCRLCDAAFSISASGAEEEKQFRLILDTQKNETSPSKRSLLAQLDIRLARIFRPSEWALLRQSERALLAHDPLARGVHALYSSRPSIYVMKLETIQAVLGRAAMQDSKFRIALETALAKVKQATDWHICELKKDGKGAGKVVVEKRVSPPRPPSQTNTRRTESMPMEHYEFEGDDI